MDTLGGAAGNDTFFARDKKADTVKGGTGRDSAQLDAKDHRSSIERRLR